MKTSFFFIAAFLLLGHAAVAGLYWGLVNVPESNVPMLLLSAFLVIAIVVVAGWIESAGVLAWISDDRPAALSRRAVRGIPAFIVALTLFAAIWWLTREALLWREAHAGEIDAWFMSRFGSPRTAWIHLVYVWTVRFLRWVVGLSLALGLVAAGAALGSRAILTRAWLMRAFSPKRLAVVSVLLIVFFLLPWQGMFWRPRGLPATWVEPVFVAVKLGLIAIVAHVGWALILRTTSRP